MPNHVRYVLMIIALFSLLLIGLVMWWIYPSQT